MVMDMTVNYNKHPAKNEYRSQVTDNDSTYDHEVLVALDETGLAGGGSTDGNYYITIPPEGSICLRGDGTNLECREVYVKCASGKTTQIEYLIAKE